MLASWEEGSCVSITPGHPNFINEAEYQELVNALNKFKAWAADEFQVEAGISGDWLWLLHFKNDLLTTDLQTVHNIFDKSSH